MEDSLSSTTIRDDSNDATLLLGMQAGDDGAFEDCLRLYCNRMLATARRILKNEEEAKDAVQDAFLSAFKSIGEFEGRSQLGTWLCRIVVNAALGRLRAMKRHPERSIDELLPRFAADEHHLEPPVPWKETPDSSIQKAETRELVQRCIDQLPESYRIVLLLRDIEGVATDEAAKLLDTSVAVVKTRLHRARQALRTLLDPHFRRGDV